ncbi:MULTISPECIES: MOSC domain-containing protein [unclassified Nocardioides]|uniref:MOSC domain-containing protein n=1 Tax=unclassified Nocardioides TaxID=2615069 RepID=UPI0007017395|nr:MULTISPECIES: MOSC domain-containing protein [unclassified Nocardioides]KQY64506.1 molybdenum cofactor biosysynthesis protein [Nocardioides sp. Root140]KRF18291.1 molybdenum cofactor biosysynthesis protein [Nocardioides sp. Soil796]
MPATVAAVHLSDTHAFSKDPTDRIRLIEGQGVEGDAHCGVTVQHRSRVAVDPSQPNLRQVHLIHAELLDELSASGFDIAPGQLGENVTTTGLDLLSLPVGTRLEVGGAVVIVTGLRNPCQQINTFRDGLLKQVVRTGEDGAVERRAGVMGVVARGGDVGPGDPIEVTLPPQPHLPLTRV